MENLLYKKVQNAKNEKEVFNETSFIFSLANKDQNVLSYFTNPNEVIFLDYQDISNYPTNKAILIAIPLNFDELILELLEVPTSFYGYRVVTSDGKKQSSNKRIKHYRGVVKGDPNSIVAISFLENEVMGLICTDKGNYNLMLDGRSGNHVFYNEKNLKKKISFNCDTVDDGFANYSKEVLSKKSKYDLSSGNICVSLYFETGHDIFQTRGSTGAVESFISGIFNQVSTLYQNENIETRLSEIFVWTTPDPYTATTSNGLLAQFQSHRTTFLGDLGQLLTFRPEIGGGIAAGFNGLCNSSVSERLSVSMIQNNFQTVPAYSWTVQVITHEFGHLFGSRHTHACVWNGNNTAIDGCAGGTEGGCPVPPIPSAGGTIMSYCHLQSVGINFNLGFGSQPGNVIRNSVDNASCLCECADSVISGPSYLCTSDTYTLIDMPVGATVIGWSASPPGAVSLSGSGNSRSVTRSTNFSGAVTLTATMNTDCGSVNVEKTIWVGVPDKPVYHDEMGNPVSYIEICVNLHHDVSMETNASLFSPILEWDWEVIVGNFNLIDLGGGFGTIIGFQSGTGFFAVKARNECGWSLPALVTVAIKDC